MSDDIPKILIGFVIVTATLFVFWQQDRNKFKYACQVMEDSEIYLSDDIGSEAESNITRAMKRARLEAECPEKRHPDMTNLLPESE